jgi:hypothetical protein
VPRFALALLIAALAAAPAQAAPDHVASEGVELVQTVRSVGAGQGVSLVGERLFVTSPTHLSVFDVHDPETPALLGAAPLDGANETEDVVTNGRVLATASPNGVTIFDVSGPTPQRLSTLDVGAQVATCVLDCRYLWATGSNAIIDLADPAHPREAGSFVDDDEDLDVGCFQAREVRPGLVLVACDPLLLISTLAEHGATPTKPKVIARGNAPEFDFLLAGAPHSAHWPRGGADAFVLSSTETPFHRDCGGDIGAFLTWDASRFTVRDHWRPQNGTYLDGRSPYNAVGCSPHFLDEHPSFRDGGLVAVAALENGVRLLSVDSAGTIAERGWFLGAGGTAAVPVWHPDGRTLYVADYARGLDVLRYTGETFVPAAASPAPSPVTAPGPAAPGRRLRIAGVVRRRGRAALAVEVPGRGRLTATGRGLRTTRVRARAAGLVTLALRLARPGRRRVAVRVRWQPRRGRAAVLRTRVTLRR